MHDNPSLISYPLGESASVDSDLSHIQSDLDKENVEPASTSTKVVLPRLPIHRNKIPLQEIYIEYPDSLAQYETIYVSPVSDSKRTFLSPVVTKRTVSPHKQSERKRMRSFEHMLHRSLSTSDLSSAKCSRQLSGLASVASPSPLSTQTSCSSEVVEDGHEEESSVEIGRTAFSEDEEEEDLNCLFERLRFQRKKKLCLKAIKGHSKSSLDDFIVSDDVVESPNSCSSSSVDNDFLSPVDLHRVIPEQKIKDLSLLFSDEEVDEARPLTKAKEVTLSKSLQQSKQLFSSWESVFNSSFESHPQPPSARPALPVVATPAKSLSNDSSSSSDLSWLSALEGPSASQPLWSDVSQENITKEPTRNNSLFSDISFSELSRVVQSLPPASEEEDKESDEFFSFSTSDTSSTSEEEDDVFSEPPSPRRPPFTMPMRKPLMHSLPPLMESPSSVPATAHTNQPPPAKVPNHTPKKPARGPNRSLTSPQPRLPSLVGHTYIPPPKLQPSKRDFLASLSEDCPPELQMDDCKKYHSNFKRHREELIQRLFAHYNEKVFDEKLPVALPIRWNPRLTKTAGRCRCFCRKRNTLADAAAGVQRVSNVRVSLYDGAKKRRNSAVMVTARNVGSGELYEFCVRIELSVKVCHNAERTRDTLIHELCHGAVWLLNRQNSDCHGPLWRYWVSVAESRCPSLPTITVYHTYAIATKFTYCCQQCGAKVHRHSRSLDVAKQVCARCFGRFVLLVNTPAGPRRASQLAPQKKGNSFADFVRQHYGELRGTPVKGEQAGAGTQTKCLPHKEVMQMLAEKFRNMKMQQSQIS